MFKISHLSLLNMCNEYKIYVEYGKKVKKVSFYSEMLRISQNSLIIGNLNLHYAV